MGVLCALLIYADSNFGGSPPHPSLEDTLILSGHYSRDWSEYVNVIGVISEPFASEFR